ncbi:MAG: EB domain-containing protein [Acidobacteriota bacterium]|nr:EB domain-containing protein [Acidobacteriota bacterium]
MTETDISEWLKPDRNDRIADTIQAMKKEYRAEAARIVLDGGIPVTNKVIEVRGSKNPELFPFEMVFDMTISNLYYSNEENRKHAVRDLISYGYPLEELPKLAWMTKESFSIYYNRLWEQKVRQRVDNLHDYELEKVLKEWVSRLMEPLSDRAKMGFTRFAVYRILPSMERTIRLTDPPARQPAPVMGKTGSMDAATALDICHKFYDGFIDNHRSFRVSVENQACNTSNGNFSAKTIVKFDMSFFALYGPPIDSDTLATYTKIVEDFWMYRIGAGVQLPGQDGLTTANLDYKTESVSQSIEQVAESTVLSLDPDTYLAYGAGHIEIEQKIAGGTLNFTLGGFGFSVGVGYGPPTYTVQKHSKMRENGDPCTIPEPTNTGGGVKGGGGPGGGIDIGDCGTCPPDHECVNGACVNLNGCVLTCPSGMECIHGACVQVGTSDCFPGIDPGCEDDWFLKTRPTEYPEPLLLGDGGILVMDTNLNNRIDGVQEFLLAIFSFEGIAYDPWDALAIFDRKEFGGNADGKISPADLVWHKLYSWRDENGNGQSTRRELIPLEEAGFPELEL